MTSAGPENTERKQKLFRRGQSGNPSGRPVGARNRATLAMEALLGAAMARRCGCAWSGSCRPAVTVRFPSNFRISQRPPTRSKPTPLSLKPVSPAEASELTKLVESFIRAIEVTDIQDRLAKLEAATR